MIVRGCEGDFGFVEDMCSVCEVLCICGLCIKGDGCCGVFFLCLSNSCLGSRFI